jgi:aryl-alcohol dehydrogenase-like predicted oxidoreductase
MQYAFLGRTGVEVSRLALGTMTFGGEADDADAAAIVHRARGAGVNLIGPADVYHEGRAESILGRRFDDVTDIGESLRALDGLVRQGKILHPACSNFAAWQVAHACGLAAAAVWRRSVQSSRCTTCSSARPRSRFSRWRRR